MRGLSSSNGHELFQYHNMYQTLGIIIQLLLSYNVGHGGRQVNISGGRRLLRSLGAFGVHCQL